MSYQIKCVLRQIFKFLSRESMPIWLSILMALATGLAAYYGTYHLVPRIDKRLQIQEIQSQYIIENVSSMNSDMQSLISETRRFSAILLDSGRIDEKIRQDMLDRISQLQWRVIDLEIIFGDDHGKKMIREYKSSLTNFRKAVEAVTSRSDLDQMFEKMEEFSIFSYRLLRALYGLAGFEVSISPVITQP